ncbi:uncharacterized protein EV422DRAFT_353275 [Fimicolochytrium jonesii]|uniref:uncharacterized protein n=1 Tax=Fimicolochytrium jonesii TaxID=1396493 RepID=UPI0022FF0436|nr:uncharacterized protein EV422DRAFT_353275 [Fimicolochytrium jonesii]KAI8823390.1 hypothetical protein EV422DRAFT_353275 [Fimicolochytrium jonesii]
MPFSSAKDNGHGEMMIDMSAPSAAFVVLTTAIKTLRALVRAGQSPYEPAVVAVLTGGATNQETDDEAVSEAIATKIDSLLDDAGRAFSAAGCPTNGAGLPPLVGAQGVGCLRLCAAKAIKTLRALVRAEQSPHEPAVVAVLTGGATIQETDDDVVSNAIATKLDAFLDDAGRSFFAAGCPTNGAGLPAVSWEHKGWGLYVFVPRGNHGYAGSATGKRGLVHRANEHLSPAYRKRKDQATYRRCHEVDVERMTVKRVAAFPAKSLSDGEVLVLETAVQVIGRFYRSAAVDAAAAAAGLDLSDGPYLGLNDSLAMAAWSSLPEHQARRGLSSQRTHRELSDLGLDSLSSWFHDHPDQATEGFLNALRGFALHAHEERLKKLDQYKIGHREVLTKSGPTKASRQYTLWNTKATLFKDKVLEQLSESAWEDLRACIVRVEIAPAGEHHPQAYVPRNLTCATEAGRVAFYVSSIDGQPEWGLWNRFGGHKRGCTSAIALCLEQVALEQNTFPDFDEAQARKIAEGVAKKRQADAGRAAKKRKT